VTGIEAILQAMSSPPENPWLGIPAEEYEGHMEAVGQSAALREIFERVVAEARPRRVAVLGCSTGGDLARLDPTRLERAAGVDLNPRYLDLARARLPELGPRLDLVHGDVLQVELPDAGRYDLIHAALLLEHVEPRALLRRIEAWLGPSGVCSLVTQEPATQPSVSETTFTSLRALAPHMKVRAAGEIAALADEAGFALASRRTVKLPSGKALVSSIFDKARKTLGRRRGYARC
jgi:SAM-dependent methyltransferase